MGVLYITATPIGNLKDITFRALEVLREADAVYAEDTRVAKKLLAHFGIQKQAFRCDAEAEERASREVVSRLLRGEKIVFIADAGTPGISDPGARIVRFVRENAPDAAVIAVPGPSAITAALSVSGIPADRFTFFGYPPHKKKRKKFFQDLAAVSVRPVVLYESPHRLVKTFDDLSAALGESAEIIVARELTKMHEEVWRGTPESAPLHFVGKRKKGEFVIVIP